MWRSIARLGLTRQLRLLPPRRRVEATPLYRAVLGAARRTHGCDSSAATIPHTHAAPGRLERRAAVAARLSSRARDADQPLARRCAPSRDARDARGTPRCDAMRTSSLLRRTHRLPLPDHPINHRRAPTQPTTASPRARRRPDHPKTFAAAIDLARVLRAEAETMPEARASPRKGVCHTSPRTNACCEPTRRRCPRWVRHQEKGVRHTPSRTNAKRRPPRTLDRGGGADGGAAGSAERKRSRAPPARALRRRPEGSLPRAGVARPAESSVGPISLGARWARVCLAPRGARRPKCSTPSGRP